MALLLFSGCRPHGRADGIRELPPNPADQARRFRLPRTGPLPTDDSDGDGVIDIDDVCPDELEFYDGEADHDGCPDGGRSWLRIGEGGEIVLAFGHELEFDDDESMLDWDHREALEQVVWLLRAHPRFTRIELTEVGDAGECEPFPCPRPSESVRMFLVGHGIDPERVHVHRRREFGLAERDDAVFGRRPNVRVELTVRLGRR
jgi:hypothetical protein